MRADVFPCAHASHAQWPVAVDRVLAQLQQTLRARVGAPPTLGLLYLTDVLAPQAHAVLERLATALPEVRDWVGTLAQGIVAGALEYQEQPAVAVMLCTLAPHQYRVFSGVAPLAAARGFVPQTALVHADPKLVEAPELVREMASRMRSGHVFGGFGSSRRTSIQFARASDGQMRGQGAASGVFEGGLSGVAFGPDVGLVSRVTQGCQPLQREGQTCVHTVTEAHDHVLVQLDGQPALDVLLADLGTNVAHLGQALPQLQQTLVGLMPGSASEAGGSRDKQAGAGDRALNRAGHFGEEVRVRHIIGLDPARRAVAIGADLEAGSRLAFCHRNAAAARADLVRICSEIREETEGSDTAPAQTRQGAVYVSCVGRGGAYFGAAHAELQWIQHALGDIPLVGFFANGEIAHNQLYGYTGVLTVFTQPAGA